MAILGLLGTESFSAERFTNIRQKVFYAYPNGSAPLLGLLSLPDSEETNDPEFSWYEKRLKKQSTTTASQGSSKGPFMTEAGADAGDSSLSITAGTVYRVNVASTDEFRPGHIVKINVARNSGAAAGEIKALVTEITSSTVLKIKPVNTTTLVDNGTTNENVGKEVLVIGNAFAHGADSTGTREIYNLPTSHGNYTQIFRTPFTITGSALKTSAKYDQSGPYKDKAKEHSVYHMIEAEKALLFGHKSKTVDSTTNQPTYTMGGILYFLERWEAGDYATVTASADSDDDKRIITNSAGTINETTYDTYLERCFRMCNNTSNEKLVLCGSGFLKTINQMYRSQSVLDAYANKDTYGMAVVKHVTPFGTVYYKTHPLFNQNAILRYNALFLDAKFMKLRPLIGRDTELLKNRQPNDADYRKDEWFGEYGFEMQFPEANLYLQNVQSYVA